LVFRNADTGVVHVDPHFRASTAATDQDAPAGLRVPDRIGQEIAQDATEQHRIAGYMYIGDNGSKIDPPFDRRIVMLVSKLPEQGSKSNGRNLQGVGAFSQIEGIDQAIELLRQLCRGSLSPVQPRLLGQLFEAGTQQLIGPLYDLQGLAKVVAEHADNRGLKFLRNDTFRVPIQQVWRRDQAFNRSHVRPLLTLDQMPASDAGRGCLAILRFGIANQLNV
jgi:hypothetical protein